LRLLLDEMFAVAEQLPARGHDAISVHEASAPVLAGLPDEDVLAAARAHGRTLVTENVRDYCLLEGCVLARGEAAFRADLHSRSPVPVGRSRHHRPPRARSRGAAPSTTLRDSSLFLARSKA